MKKVLSLILCVSIVFTALIALASVTALAEPTTYSFSDLLAQNKVKIQGRSKKDMVTAYWTGNAVELNINNAGGDVTVKINTTESEVYFEGFIDGQSIGRSDKPATMTNPDITFTNIPAGEHLLRIVRESGTSKDTTAFTFFDSITFNGTIGERPADRKLYVEIIGDSVATGAGSLGVFGDDHKNEYHSGTHSFGYYIADELGADYSIVAAGGVGLYELSPDKKEWYDGVPVNIQKMYEYTNGVPDFDIAENEYDFPRKPDLIIIRIGANDDTKNETQWQKDFTDFVKRIHELNGDNVPIVYSGKAGTPHYLSVQNARSQSLKNDHIYMVSTVVGGSGTAALKTQTSGHPNAKEQKELADSILEVIRKNNLDQPIDHTAATETETETETENGGVETIGALPEDRVEKSFFKNNYLVLYVIAGFISVCIICAVICFAVFGKKKKPILPTGESIDDPPHPEEEKKE